MTEKWLTGSDVRRPTTSSETMLQRLDAMRLNDGNLPQWAFPGGYTIGYYTHDGEILCATCADSDETQEATAAVVPTWESIVAVGCYDEGPTLQCAGCNCDIESSYGDPDESAE